MRAVDHASFAGKTPVPSQHVALLVIGAGRSGIVAACNAAQTGIRTMLVEEQPVPESLMRLDVPHYFGQRLMGARSGAQMMEQILESNPALAEAYEAGIDVQLGVCVWAVFKMSADAQAARFLVGLADESRSWLVACDRLVVATGSRDVCLAFPGWDKPGVMGALAALQLMERYDAFNGTRMVVLGSGPLADRVVSAAARKGIAVACQVKIEEVSDEAAAAAERSADPPLSVLHGYGIRSAGGGAEVEFAELVRINNHGQPIEGSEVRVPCDTIVLALGAVPNIELLDSLGCHTEFRAESGGWVPQLTDGVTSIPFVSAVGSCAGLSGDPGVPQLRQWLRAQIATSGLDVLTCQCEEVTRGELLGLKPPRYVSSTTPKCSRDLATLGADGPLNQDQVKRLTRAGMGPCQGRRCREQIQAIIEDVTGAVPGAVPLARYRPPVRPLPVSLLAADDESSALKDNWVAWFNIATQWLAHWEPRPVPLPDAGHQVTIGEGE